MLRLQSEELQKTGKGIVAPLAITGGVFSSGASFGVTSNYTSTLSPVVSSISLEDAISTNVFELPENVDTVLEVTLGAPQSGSLRDRLYQLSATPDDLQAGEFYYNPSSNQLIVAPIGEVQTSSLNYTYVPLEPELVAIRTTYIDPPYPSFLFQWNVSGTVEINRSLQQHPSASIQLIACQSEEKSIRSSLKNGTEVSLYGVRYFINSIEINRLSLKEFPAGWIEVRLSLLGIYAPRANPSRSPLDKPIRLKSLGASGTEASIQTLAARSGVFYDGADIQIDIPKDTPSSAFTKFREELEKRSVIYNSFVYYSDPNAVKTKLWGQTTLHNLASSEIVSKVISITAPGHGTLTDCVGLVEEYRNTVFKLDKSNQDKYEADEEICRYEFENAETIGQVSIPFTDASQKLDVDQLRDPANCFDNGGKTKTRRKIRERNGVEISREETIFGLAFTTAETYLVKLDDEGEPIGVTFGYNLSVRDFWQPIEQTTTTHTFSSEGYLIRSDRRGWRLTRMKQETQELEAIKLQQELLSAVPNTEDYARIFNEQQLYAFTERFPINDVTDYDLNSYRKYYDDIKEPDPDETDFIEPRFVSKMTRLNAAIITKEDPNNSEDEPLPELVTRQNYQEIQINQVITPRSKTTPRRRPEKYRSIAYRASASGERGKNVLTIATVNDNNGRPPIQTLLKRNTRSNVSNAPEDIDNWKYYLCSTEAPFNPTSSDLDNAAKYTQTYSSINQTSDLPLEENSISFPGVDDPEIGRKAAQTKISLANSQKAEVVRLSTLRRSEFNEGDLLFWDGKIWVILTIRDRQKISRVNSGVRLDSENFALTLGRFIQVPVTMKKYRVDKS